MGERQKGMRMSQRTEVRIGVTWSDSGWCWLDSRFLFTGLQVWLKQTNARGGMFVPEVGRHLPVRLIRADDRSYPPVAVAAVTRMIDQEAIDVLCSSGSSEVQAEVLKQTEAAGIVNLNVGAPDPKLFSGTRYHLQCGPSLSGYYLSRPRFWRAFGLRRIAVLAADLPGWNAITDGLRQAIASEGLELVFLDQVARQEQWSTDNGPYASKFGEWASVASRLSDANADAMVIALPAPAQYRLMQEIKRQGLWWWYLEMMYSLALTRVGFSSQDLLYQFGGAHIRDVEVNEITVGCTQAELDSEAQRWLPGVEAHVYGRSYVGPALWAHLVESAGTLAGDAVMAQAFAESGQLVSLEGKLEWQGNGDTVADQDGVSSILQVQRHPWTADLYRVPVWPPEIAEAEPIWTDRPYEDRPPPWSGAPI
jgi:hypothetical protein